jgi:hypothetical protein
MIGTLTFEIEGIDKNQLDKLKDLVDTLIIQKVFLMRDSSAEIFLDDEGILQEIRFNNKKRRRTGDPFKMLNVQGGKAVVSFDNQGIIQQVIYQTAWKRKLAN